jgi:hypothetical protein
LSDTSDALLTNFSGNGRTIWRGPREA